MPKELNFNHPISIHVGKRTLLDIKLRELLQAEVDRTGCDCSSIIKEAVVAHLSNKKDDEYLTLEKIVKREGLGK